MSNVIKTEFTALDALLRRIDEIRPKEIVITYVFEDEGDEVIRVAYLGLERSKLIGMLFGAAQDIWNDPEKTVREIKPHMSS